MFKFNGISSDEMGVVVAEEELFLARAPRKYEMTEINGRDGAIIEELGYSNLEIPMTLQITNVNRLDDIFKWLNGKGILEYKNRIANACFYNEISPQRVANIKIADITFIRSPFWSKKDDPFSVVTTEIINEGTVCSKPILRLEKKESQIVDLTIAGIRIVYDFKNESYVDIDCENYYASYNNLNRNRNLEIGYEFPKIYPGSNPIVINSGDPLIKIKRKDRWL